MDKPTPKERLVHIRSAINKIISFVRDQSVDEFIADPLRQDAVLFQFIIIGEAIRHVDKKILDKYPYTWHIPMSFRNFITHEYHKISMVRVYNAAHSLNELVNIIEIILEKEFNTDSELSL